MLLANLREERDKRNLEALRQYQQEAATMMQSVWRGKLTDASSFQQVLIILHPTGTQRRRRYKKLKNRARRKQRQVERTAAMMRNQMSRGSHRLGDSAAMP